MVSTKKHGVKKWSCIVIAVAMLLCCIPGGALAAPTITDDGSGKINAIVKASDTLSINNILINYIDYSSLIISASGGTIDGGGTFIENVDLELNGGDVTLRNLNFAEAKIHVIKNTTLILSGDSILQSLTGFDAVTIDDKCTLTISSQSSGSLDIKVIDNDYIGISGTGTAEFSVQGGTISISNSRNDTKCISSALKISGGSLWLNNWNPGASNDSTKKYPVEVRCVYENNEPVNNATVSYGTLKAKTNTDGIAYMWLPLVQGKVNKDSFSTDNSNYTLSISEEYIDTPPVVTITLIEKPVEPAKDTDATLYSLQIRSTTSHTLSPAFDSYQYNYTLDVDNTVSKVTLIALPNKSTSLLTAYNVTTDTYIEKNGVASVNREVSLLTGDNIIRITVTAENGNTIPYSITVNRAEPPPTPTPDPNATPKPSPTLTPTPTPIPPDTKPPTIISASANARDKAIILSAFALDENSGTLRYKWQFIKDGKWVDLSNGTGPYIVLDTALPGNSYIFRVLIYDDAGNHVISEDLKVTANLPRNARPGVGITNYIEPIPAIINGKKVAVRSGPMTNYPEVATLYRGNSIDVNGIQGSWACVAWQGVSYSAWIHAGYLNWDDRPPIPAYLTEPVFVRSGPGPSYAAVGTLARGTRVDLLNRRGNYYMIMADGMPCYIHARYIMMM